MGWNYRIGGKDHVRKLSLTLKVEDFFIMFEI